MIPEETSAVTGSLGAPARPYFWNRDGAPNRVLPPPGKQGESGMGSAAGSGYLYPVAALAANRLTVGRYAFSSRFDRTGFVLGNKLGNSARGGTSNVRASAGASIGDFLRQASTKWSNAAIEIPSAPVTLRKPTLTEARLQWMADLVRAILEAESIKKSSPMMKRPPGT